MPVVAEEQGVCFLQLYLCHPQNKAYLALTSLLGPHLSETGGQAAFLLMLCVAFPSSPPFNSPCTGSVQQGMNFSHKDFQTAPDSHTTGRGAASRNAIPGCCNLSRHPPQTPRPPKTMAAFPWQVVLSDKKPCLVLSLNHSSNARAPTQLPQRTNHISHLFVPFVYFTGPPHEPGRNTLEKKNYSNANYSGRYTSPSMFIRLRALYFDVNKQFFQPGLLPDPFNPSIYY